ncbi:MAG: flagellar biosynthesis protein FlhA, partial [Myxococcaceae bacterium]
MTVRLASLFSRAKRSSDIVLALVMAAILAALIVPLPAWAVDLGLALNLAAAVSLLVAALSAENALKVASFPTVLLITTLFRLALNVSSTRLALAEGHAGRVIEAFGEFVVRGEYVVGAVIFVILTLVQFLVVAKGAERVAEVSARFTLDAMPGKQMSIDADLRAGAIDQAQARSRRRELERESQLFGSMDGAMKFVKGDVIAGLVIVLVNLFGGVAIGVFQAGMSFSEAASTYALIAIGDGLVSQIPSLCIAVAAGLVVTRVASEDVSSSLGADVGTQFFGSARALGIVSGLCTALALMPKMPAVPFLLLALFSGGGAYLSSRRASAAAAKKPASAGSPAASASGATVPAPNVPSVGVSPLTLDLSTDLNALVEAEEGRFVKKDLEALRDQLFLELGVRIPGIRIRTGASYLPAKSYCFMVDEVPVGRGVVDPSALYALSAPADLAFLQVKAEEANEPGTGKSISRVPVESRSR